MTRKLNEGDVYWARDWIIPIGAFVEFLPGKEGMIHISNQLNRARSKMKWKLVMK